MRCSLRLRTAAPLVLAAAALAAGPALAGDAAEPGAFWPTNVDLTRSSGMAGAHSAVATGNDALTVNPAGLSQTKRYHFQVDGAFDSRFPGQGVSLSIADSTSVAAGTGLLFQRWGAGVPDGRGEGWLAGVGYSYFAGSFFFGGLTKYLHFDGSQGEIHQFAQDIGLLARTSDFKWSMVVKNLSSSTIPLFPPQSTVGCAWGNETDWNLALDYKTDLQDFNNLKHQLALGGEVVIDKTLVLRAGYGWAITDKLGSISVGASLITEKLGLHFAWRRRVQGSLEQFFEGGLTLYLE